MKIKQKLFISIAIILVVSAAVFSFIFPLTVSKMKEVSVKNLVAEERATGSEASDSGASEADKSLKGGAIYIEPQATYTMSGGTISGSSNTYGGAIFISTGATFTMTGGTISGCSAKYGGGIYVSTGATLTITAGTITKCTAEQGPAIYIEDGAIVDISPDADISENDIYQYVNWQPPEVGPEADCGGKYYDSYSSLRLKTMTFGTYPQTKVDDTMNTTLENWYSGRPEGKKYIIEDRVWTTYRYDDGQSYVRGISTSGSISWFKVEPIKWFILNYDEWQSGSADIELLSTMALTGLKFNSSESAGNEWAKSDLRAWLNGDFYDKAFNAKDKELINEVEIKNNITGDFDTSTSDGKGTTTFDFIYCLSYWDMADPNGLFQKSGDRLLLSPTDFARANNCWGADSRGPAYTFFGRLISDYWSRSAGEESNFACGVYNCVSLKYNGSSSVVTYEHNGVRPALRLNIKAS